MQHKILFVTWDGPQTSYMEGLFLPIFNEIKKNYAVDFHVLQFTWADVSKTNTVKSLAESMGIPYATYPVSRKPIAVLGSVLTLFKGIRVIENYIKANGITIVMPRSTMPSVMVNRLRNKNVKIIFDADGLPLEERVDFAGLSKESKQYLWLKKEETQLLKKADLVLTRSRKSVAIHLQHIGAFYKSKFHVVYNGRSASFFKPDATAKLKTREEMGFQEKDTVFVYCGSLGPQYGWDEMLSVFTRFHERNANAKFLILSGNPEYAEVRLPSSLRHSVVVKKVPFDAVPHYLNCADVAFAIRKPTFSMQGVAPIKLGEYLLMGIPTIASMGIGDTEALLESVSGTFLFDHDDANAVKKAVIFAADLKYATGPLREAGKRCFSLEKSAASYIEVLQKL